MNDTLLRSSHHDETTTVLIVGGGLVGLSMSLFLSWHGIASVLVDWIEQYPDGTCRLTCRTEIDSEPRIAQFFVRQMVTKLLPENLEHRPTR
jgi:hypothetical protein